ncbi:MAG: glycosyltransferase family 39 protein, partial [Phycisphaerae bacterium]
PLAHYWAALPLRVMPLRFPPHNQQAWRRSDVWIIGGQFFFEMGNDADAMLRRGRAMIALLSTALGLIVFLWSRRLFGAAGGLLSLALYAVSPTMLAHGALITTDLVAALCFTASMAALWRVSHRMSPGNVAVAMIALGGMILAKGSGVVIAFLGVVVIAVRIASNRPITIAWPGGAREIPGRLKRAALLSALTALLVLSTAALVWGAYGFRWSPFRGGASTPQGYRDDALARRYDYFTAGPTPAGKTAWEHQTRSLDDWKVGVCNWLHESRLLPDAYVYGFLAMLQSARGRDSFLNGSRTLCGSGWFFPYAFLVKTPLPLFLALYAAALATVLFKGRLKTAGPASVSPLNKGGLRGVSPARAASETSPNAPVSKRAAAAAVELKSPARNLLYDTIPIWILLGVYGFLAFRSTLNIGHRHLLSLYPGLCILAGAAAAWRHASRKPLRLIPPALAVLMAAASLSIYPHYLAYFNWLAGGPRNGYKHLVDSSLDWGQDLKGLAAWLEDRGLKSGGDRPVYVQYFGRDRLAHRGISARRLYQPLSRDATGDYNLTGGLYCISATNFQQVYVLSLAELARLGLGVRENFANMPVDWRPELEKFYQPLHAAAREFENLPDDSAKRLEFLKARFGENYRATFLLYQKLRFMRLCAHLRHREPDEMIGYSILIFDLTNPDLTRFLDSAPPP